MPVRTPSLVCDLCRLGNFGQDVGCYEQSVRTMTPALDEALQTIMAHLDRWLEPPPEPGVTMSHEAVLESLQWLSAANYGAAVHLTRLRNAGVELKREDGKDLDRWIVEQVRMASLAGSARTEYNERNGLVGGG